MFQQIGDRAAQAATQRAPASSDLREKSELMIHQHFGDVQLPIVINDAIWRQIRSDEDHAFRLSCLDAVAESCECEPGDVLTVLFLLSDSKGGVLVMKMTTASGEVREVALEDFIGKLRAWWREKTMLEAEWEQWASNVRVKWVPVDGAGNEVRQ